MIFEHEKIPNFSLSGLQICVKALLGDPIPSSNETRYLLNVESMLAIRSVIRTQIPFWNFVKFDVQLPDVNVLIPPYMNDEKVLRYNPELPQH